MIMASQAAIFAETIAGMKKAVKRKAYDSDSDSSIEQHTNRGNKLLKKSRFVHEGQLAPPTGPLVYKRQIEHAGYMREIISQNAPLIDEEGYEVESDDDDEKVEEALATAAEMDPYSSIQIEQLLAPLTSAAELPTHPTLSKPFTSKTLTELTQQAGEMVQKENASLWKIKHLLTRLSGDSSWIPCGVVEAESDYGYFLEEQDRQQAGIQNKEVPSDEGDHGSTGTLISEEEQPAGLRPGDPDVEMHTAVDATEAIDERAADAILKEFLAPKVGTNGDSTSIVESVGEGGRFPTSNGTAIATEVPPGAPTNGVIVTDEKAMAADERSQNAENDTEMGAEDDADAPAPHRMRTRAQAQAVSDETPSGTRSATPEPNDQYLIHPYFVAPSMSRPDRDLGLPSNEAEETRRLLQLYIQKQEEVCRGAEKVYNGLLKASRYRKMVLEWTRAESHVGIYRDMADGEDWYDKEAWGLDEDLKKGQDEDDDEGATAGSTTKKTRSRRQ